MQSGSHFKNTPVVLNMLWADASKFKRVTFSTDDMSAKQTITASNCCFPNHMKGQRFVHITQSDQFQKYPQNLQF